MNDTDLIAEALSCARYNEADELAQLLDANPKLSLSSLKDVNGNTPLHMACANAHLEIVDLLCRRFPLPEDINSQNSEGNTALHWAALNGHAEVVSRLLEANADVKLKNVNGLSAMTEAQGRGYDAIVTELLARFDDDDADDDGDAEAGDAEGSGAAI
ncbi:ankyrin repeat-containing domain protein [Syncephalis plumigaleata]|nr:ankyrin repeat-containing domain protein [Syncephalis plumigaleata]